MFKGGGGGAEKEAGTYAVSLAEKGRGCCGLHNAAPRIHSLCYESSLC